MRKISSFLITALVLTSCSSSKFDYQTAYKFSHISNEKQIQGEVQNRQSIDPLASIGPKILSPTALPSDIALNETNSVETADKFLQQYQNASKQEKKKLRKQVKQEYKLLRKEVKEAKQEAQTQDIVFNKKMYIGAVILAAGILVAILASGGVGAVGIIVGIALIAWGFIEQA